MAARKKAPDPTPRKSAPDLGSRVEALEKLVGELASEVKKTQSRLKGLSAPGPSPGLPSCHVCGKSKPLQSVPIPLKNDPKAPRILRDVCSDCEGHNRG